MVSVSVALLLAGSRIGDAGGRRHRGGVASEPVAAAEIVQLAV